MRHRESNIQTARRQIAPWSLGVLACLVLGDLVVLSPLEPVWTWVAALVGLGLLPGGLMVALFFGGDNRISGLERAAQSVGLGYGAIICGLFLLQALPGAVSRWQVLLASNGLSALLFALVWRRVGLPRWPLRPSIRWLLASGAVLVLGLFLRFANLGHSEFQGDEIAVMQRAREVVVGDEQALFSHKKGPAEILLTTLGYAATQRASERRGSASAFFLGEPRRRGWHLQDRRPVSVSARRLVGGSDRRFGWPSGGLWAHRPVPEPCDHVWCLGTAVRAALR